MVKKRENYTPLDLKILNISFLINKVPSFEERKIIAKEIKKSEISIKYWFRNKRYKLKKIINENKSNILDSAEILEVLSLI